MSLRFVVTPADGAGHAGPGADGRGLDLDPDPDPSGPNPDSSPDPRVDALPILRYCREPSRYGGSSYTPEHSRSSASRPGTRPWLWYAVLTMAWLCRCLAGW